MIVRSSNWVPGARLNHEPDRVQVYLRVPRLPGKVYLLLHAYDSSSLHGKHKVCDRLRSEKGSKERVKIQTIRLTNTSSFFLIVRSGNWVPGARLNHEPDRVQVYLRVPRLPGQVYLLLHAYDSSSLHGKHKVCDRLGSEKGSKERV